MIEVDYRVYVNAFLGLNSMALMIWGMWRLRHWKLGNVFWAAVAIVGYFVWAYLLIPFGFITDNELPVLLRPTTGPLLLLPGLLALAVVATLKGE